MTTEEAILYMSLYKKKLEVSVSDGLEEDIEAFNMAIKALKQSDNIDKIRAEIGWMNSAAYMGEYNVGLRDALKVIDKYTKSEVKK